MLETIDPTHIDPFQIDTPWEPQDIVWRYPMSTRHDALRYQAMLQPTHLVREITMENPATGGTIRTIEEVDASLTHTHEQFALMEECGIAIPEVEWHSFVDSRQAVRHLAKIAIINGEIPAPNMNDVKQSIAAYQLHPQARRARLSDVSSLRQYLFGRPKAAPSANTTPPQLYLVDIEPRY